MPTEELVAGEVGYIIAQIKSVAHTKVGDTVFDADRRAASLLPGYREVKPMVFAGLYPSDTDQYERLRNALDKDSVDILVPLLMVDPVEQKEGLNLRRHGFTLRVRIQVSGFPVAVGEMLGLKGVTNRVRVA